MPSPWGKVIGGMFGFLVGRYLGMLSGVAVGHVLDLTLDQHRVRLRKPVSGDIDPVYFDVAYGLLGYLAKADGRVSRAEIQFAESVMAQMRLDSRARSEAIERFAVGKSADFDIQSALSAFASRYRQELDVARTLLEMLVQMAYADGPPSSRQSSLLRHIQRAIHLSDFELKRLEALVGARYEKRNRPASRPVGDLVSAYELLGVSPGASESEVKRSYRRMISQHHPDKLISKGFSEERLKKAAEKTREIRHAYETIRLRRGF
ncbi:MAG: co-chaperone DjlA [Pseudomonadota bacterium]|nr:co-chaperone DjlA [Pseudomonadota bacterium]